MCWDCNGVSVQSHWLYDNYSIPLIRDSVTLSYLPEFCCTFDLSLLSHAALSCWLNCLMAISGRTSLILIPSCVPDAIENAYQENQTLSRHELFSFCQDEALIRVDPTFAWPGLIPVCRYALRVSQNHRSTLPVFLEFLITETFYQTNADIFASNGDITPPCGVPNPSVSKYFPSSITLSFQPALYQL